MKILGNLSDLVKGLALKEGGIIKPLIVFDKVHKHAKSLDYMMLRRSVWPYLQYC